MTGLNAGKKTQEEKPASSSTLISSIKECPVWMYREIICNDNLSVLVVSGEPTKEELESAAFNIINEYNDAINASSPIDPLKREMLYRSSMIRTLDYCLQVASCGKFDVILAILNDLSIRLKEPSNDLETEAFIKKLQARIKAERARMNEAAHRYKKSQQNGSQKQNKITEEQFDDNITSLRTALKDPYITDQIMLHELASYIRVYSKLNKPKAPTK